MVGKDEYLFIFNFKDDFLSILSCQNRADGSQFSSGENEAEEF